MSLEVNSSSLGREYNWKDISIQMLGKRVTGARSVSYELKRESKNIYALGGEPVAIARSKKEYDATIGLLQSELEVLQSSLPSGRDLTDIEPFDVVVVYAFELGKIVTDILKGCRFTQIKKNMKVDDEFMEIELPIAVARIQYNI